MSNKESDDLKVVDPDELFEDGVEDPTMTSGGLDAEDEVIGGLEEDDEVIDVSDYPDTFQDEIWPKKRYKGIVTNYQHRPSSKGDKMHDWEITVRNPNAARIQTKKLHLYIVRTDANKYREKAAIKAIAPDAPPFPVSQGAQHFVGRAVWVDIDSQNDNRDKTGKTKQNVIKAAFPYEDNGFDE